MMVHSAVAAFASSATLHVATWHDFSFAAVGIAGALAGLIFVSISLNLDFVLENSHLPARGGTALVVLLGVAVVNLCVLVPGQSPLTLALESWFVALVAALCALRTAQQTYAKKRESDPLAWTINPLLTNMLPVCAWIAAGCLVLATGNLALYALATIVGILVPVWEAWVLLVEIRR